MVIRHVLLAAVAFASFVPFGVTGTKAAAPVTLFAVLFGANECNNVAAPAGPVCSVGDLDAIGSATMTFPTATSVCFGITVDNLAGATAAHVHRGSPGLNGGIVVTLVAPLAPSAGDPGASSGCKSGLPAGLVADIIDSPRDFYVNVHNAAFPGGAIRGQLF